MNVLSSGKSALYALRSKWGRSSISTRRHHQDYLDKAPAATAHIPASEINAAGSADNRPGDYESPPKLIRRKPPMTVPCDAAGGHGAPFANQYWDFTARASTLDVVTGEPLFTSLSKFENSCGWPAFSAPSRTVLAERAGLQLRHGPYRGTQRAVIPSDLCSTATRNPSHQTLLHQQPRCALLRTNMDAEGYGYLKYLFENKAHDVRFLFAVSCFQIEKGIKLIRRKGTNSYEIMVC